MLIFGGLCHTPDIKCLRFILFREVCSVSGWRLTATTIYCDAVDDDVTLVVDKDLNVRCTGYSRYVTNPNKETTMALGRKSRELGRNLRCEGPQDFRVTDYRDKLIAEEDTIHR
jgi:hypothetical protein